MNSLNRICLGISTVALFVMGSLGILISTEIITVEMINQYLSEEWMSLVVFETSILLWILTVITIYITFIREDEERQKMILLQRGSEGEVTITTKALENSVKNLCFEEKFVKTAKTKIIIKKKRVCIRVVAVIWTDIPLPEATTNLQMKIKDYLGETVGLKDIGQIKLVVKEILHKPSLTPSVQKGRIEYP